MKEKLKTQSLVQCVGLAIYCAALAVAGVDQRFRWSPTLLATVPLWLTVLAQALVLGSYALAFWVMKVNRFASRTIQVEEDQSVVSNGPYRWVRHPMYFGIVVMNLSLPLALGSYIAVIVFVLFIPLLVLRLLNEESLLQRQLPGYSEYCQRIRFRLIPFVW